MVSSPEDDKDAGPITTGANQEAAVSESAGAPIGPPWNIRSARVIASVIGGNGLLFLLMERIATDADWSPIYSGSAVGVLALAWSAAVFVAVDRVSCRLAPGRRSLLAVAAGLGALLAFASLWACADAVVLPFDPQSLPEEEARVVPAEQLRPDGMWQPPPLLWPLTLPEDFRAEVERAVEFHDGSFEQALYWHRETWRDQLEISHPLSLTLTRSVLLLLYLLTSALVAVFASLASGKRTSARADAGTGHALPDH